MDLRMMAISRLMLDNFPHIKAYWVMLGIKTAQVALSYGADDIDGTVVHEKIYHDAGSDTPQELTVAELRRLIEEAGRVPVERDTLYHEVIRERAATGRRGGRWRCRWWRCSEYGIDQLFAYRTERRGHRIGAAESAFPV